MIYCTFPYHCNFAIFICQNITIDIKSFCQYPYVNFGAANKDNPNVPNYVIHNVNLKIRGKQ